MKFTLLFLLFLTSVPAFAAEPNCRYKDFVGTFTPGALKYCWNNQFTYSELIKVTGEDLGDQVKMTYVYREWYATSPAYTREVIIDKDFSYDRWTFGICGKNAGGEISYTGFERNNRFSAYDGHYALYSHTDGSYEAATKNCLYEMIKQ